MPGILNRASRRLFGPKLPDSAGHHQRMSNTAALAVLNSDAISSVAYATDEVMWSLAAASPLLLGLTWPIAIGIAVLILIVGVSYRQTLFGYPDGGGSYIVAMSNLGKIPGLVAGAMLLQDYTLTSAVSISSGVEAITSAWQGLHPWAIIMGLSFLLVIVWGNLRGLRESSTIFQVPTYLFVFLFGATLIKGFFDFYVRGVVIPEPAMATGAALPSMGSWLMTLIVAKAFASGCTALTGVEATANGVPAFYPPEAKNAAKTMTWMMILLGSLFLGSAWLAVQWHLRPDAAETLLSKLTAVVWGRGIVYQLVQLSTMAILIMAANTAFADFPRLSSLLARDGFFPHQMARRGDRLVFHNGILLLGGFTALLIVVFKATTHLLMPLFAVGVFTAFTLSQAGMVVHWYKERHANPRWWLSSIINGVGSLTTAIVTLVITWTKFMHGAWVVVLMTPLLMALFLAIRRHYEVVKEQCRLDVARPNLTPTAPLVIVPIDRLDKPVVQCLKLAKALAADGEIRCLYVSSTAEPEREEAIRRQWAEWGTGIPLDILHTRYRELIGPLLRYIGMADRKKPDDLVTVVIPEVVPARWWHHFLHAQTALRIKAALLFHERNIAVVSVPYRLEH